MDSAHKEVENMSYNIVLALLMGFIALVYSAFFYALLC